MIKPARRTGLGGSELKHDSADTNGLSHPVTKNHRQTAFRQTPDQPPMEGPALATLIGDTLDISVVGMMILDAEMRVAWVNRTPPGPGAK